MAASVPNDPSRAHGRPYLLAASAGEDEIREELKLARAKNPFASGTLGDLGVAIRVTGPPSFAETMLVQPLELVAGIDLASARFFLADARAKTQRPVWNSGVNVGLGYAWAAIRRPGVYVLIGLPRDRLLQELIQSLAERRRLRDLDSDKARELTREMFAPLLEIPDGELDDLRSFL